MRKLIFTLTLFAATACAGQDDVESNQLGLMLGAEFIGDHSTATNPSVPIKFTNSVVFQRLRGEIRDFYSFDTLNFTTPIRDSHQHNVIVSGGLIVRF